MECKRPKNSQSKLEQKEQSWRYHNASLQNILKSYNLKKKKLHGSSIKAVMEQRTQKLIHPSTAS
jgi:hypothetical protein